MSSKKKPSNELILIYEKSKDKNEKSNNIDNTKSIDSTDYDNVKMIDEIQGTKFKFKKIKCKCKKCKLKCNKYLNIIKIIFINLSVLIYNLLAFFLYYLSLKGCFESQSSCISLLSTMFLGRLLIFGILSALMITIELYLFVIKKISIFHIIYIIIFYIFIYYYDHGTKLNYHGLYNFVLTIFFILFFSSILVIINLVIYIKRKKDKVYNTIFVIFLIYILIKLIIFIFSLNNSCKNWDKGLNSTILNNSPEEYNCKIIYPKKCLINIFNDYFDISYYLHKKCSINDRQEKEHKKYLKYLKLDKELISLSNMTHFGLPITVNNPIFRESNINDYFKVHNFVYKNTILMDLYNNNKTKYYNNTLQPEIEIIYDKKSKKRTAKINIIKNETLSKIRNEIATNPNNTNISLFNNILIIYTDSVSRQYFLKKLKKTSSFIEKFMKYNNDLGFSAFQFMKYQTFAHWTQPNVYPMFFSSRNAYGKKINIVKHLKDNGYITGNSGNLCSKEPFEIDIQEYRIRGIIWDEYDHENIAMFCDPNYSSEDSPYPIFSGPYGILRKCLYGLDSFKYLIEFGKQFWNIYKDNKKYLKLSFQDGHEPTGQVIKYMDEYLYNFLNELYEQKLLNDTSIFILSDHGNSYFNYIYYYILRSDDSLIERYYGTLFIILPSNKNKTINEDYYNNIHKNQQALISPFDIHDTLIHIIFGDNTLFNQDLYSLYGNSLLTDFDIKIRNCTKWKGYMIDGKICICEIN